MMPRFSQWHSAWRRWNGAEPGGWTRAILICSTIVLVALTAVFWLYGFLGPPGWRVSHDDLAIYTEATRRLLAGGSWYLERQLNGPYQIQHGDVLFPPVAAWFFALWLVLPTWSFVVVPVALTAWAVARMRPSVWTWPLLALCVLWPMFGLKVLRSNPNVWVMAAVAMGLLYRWPGAFILAKPSMVPFALIGSRSRGWWAVAALLLVGSLPVLADTLIYPTVVFNGEGGGILYSLPDLPFALLPVIAWVGRRGLRGGSTPLGPDPEPGVSSNGFSLRTKGLTRL